MPAPVYEVGDSLVRVCWDGWMFEVESADDHNIDGRCLTQSEREEVLKAIANGSAIKLK